MTWWTDYQTRRGQDRKTLYADNMKNLVSTEFKNSTSYNLVKINNIDRKTRIVEESSLVKNPSKKRLLCFPNESILIGDIVTYDNSNWICVNNDTTSQISDVGIIERCNNTLSFYSSNIPYSIPCIIGSQISLTTTLSTDENKYIQTLSNEIFVRVGANSDTLLIKENMQFKIGLKNYKVESISDIVENGLLVMKMVFEASETVLPVYTVEILNGSTVSTQQGNTIQLNIQVKDNDIVLTSPPPVIFSSSNVSIASVSSSGLITTLSVGSATITCKLQSDNNIFDTFVVTVEAIPVAETYTLELTGNIQPDTEIKSGSTKTYTCVKKNSLGIVVSGAEFDFSIVNGSTLPSAYIFTVLSDQQCSIRCNSYTYYIDLVAIDRLDNTLTVSKHIKLRSVL